MMQKQKKIFPQVGIIIAEIDFGIIKNKYNMLIHTCVLDNITIYVVNELTRSSNQLINSLV